VILAISPNATTVTAGGGTASLTDAEVVELRRALAQWPGTVRDWAPGDLVTSGVLRRAHVVREAHPGLLYVMCTEVVIDSRDARPPTSGMPACKTCGARVEAARRMREATTS
jgi:hypothetical protein